MSTISLEQRVAALEAGVARLKNEQDGASTFRKPWWEEIRGSFKDDPVYDEAMRLGREWRKAQRTEDKAAPNS